MQWRNKYYSIENNSSENNKYELVNLLDDRLCYGLYALSFAVEVADGCLESILVQHLIEARDRIRVLDDDSQHCYAGLHGCLLWHTLLSAPTDTIRASGEILTPEARLCWDSRTRGAFVRGFRAGAGVPDGIPYERGPPASFWRRNGGSSGNRVREGPSGAHRALPCEKRRQLPL